MYSARGQSLDKFLAAADLAYQQRDYALAMDYYATALEIEKERTHIWYQYAESARQFNALDEAKTAYLYLLENMDLSFFPLTQYRLAQVHQKMGDYQEAIIAYEEFLNQDNLAAGTEAENAKKNISYCRWASKAVLEPILYQVEALGTSVNTSYSEFGAVWQGSTLYYSSYSQFNEEEDRFPLRPYMRIMRMYKGEQGELFSSIEPTEDGHLAHPAFNLEGNAIYFTRCLYSGETNKRCAIYVSKKDNNLNWSLPERLPEHINAPNATTTQPALGYHYATGQKGLYFVSNRVGGKGKLDIWWAALNEQEEFDKPVNLQDINTADNDVTPSFHPLSQTLYFSSDGRQTFGGYDIYKARLREEVWRPVEHLAAAINSSHDDYYYSLTPKGEKGIFSTNRPNQTPLDAKYSTCCLDLFTVEHDIITDLEISVLDIESGETLSGVDIEVNLLAEERQKWGHQISKKDTTLFELEKYRVYEIKASKYAYLPKVDTIRLNLEKNEALETFPYTFRLKAIEVDLKPEAIDLGDSLALADLEWRLVESDSTSHRILDTVNIQNDFYIRLKVGKQYKLIGKKEGYTRSTDTIFFNTIPIDTHTVITKQFFYQRKDFDDFLPLALHFDSDSPDSRTMKTTTNKNYEQAWKAYYDKKELYKKRLTDALPPTQRYEAFQELHDFFYYDFKQSFRYLNAFSEKLLVYLKQGNTVNITLQGFTSPSGNKKYNTNLGKRRVTCVKNHFATFKNGALLPYLQNGQMQINLLSFGAADASIDTAIPKKVRKYTLEAIKSRRVEILQMKVD